MYYNLWGYTLLLLITVFGYGQYEYLLNTWRNYVEIKYIVLNGNRYLVI